MGPKVSSTTRRSKKGTEPISAIGDFLAKYGILSGLGVTLVGLTVSWLRSRYDKPKGVNAALQTGSADLEIIPLWFEVSLHPPTPELYVDLQIVNHRDQPLALDEVKVTYFHVNSAPSLDNIVSTDYEVPAHQSKRVRCYRRLIDSEIRGYASLQRLDRFDGTIHVTARGSAGKKNIKYVNTSFAMYGWVKGLPSPPVATASA